MLANSTLQYMLNNITDDSHDKVGDQLLDLKLIS